MTDPDFAAVVDESTDGALGPLLYAVLRDIAERVAVGALPTSPTSGSFSPESFRCWARGGSSPSMTTRPLRGSSNGLPTPRPSSPRASVPRCAGRPDKLLILASAGRVDLRHAFVAEGWAAWASFGCTFAGWLLAAIVVAGLSGVFKRN
jgi:hypothetical protein